MYAIKHSCLIHFFLWSLRLYILFYNALYVSSVTPVSERAADIASFLDNGIGSTRVLPEDRCEDLMLAESEEVLSVNDDVELYMSIGFHGGDTTCNTSNVDFGCIIQSWCSFQPWTSVSTLIELSVNVGRSANENHFFMYGNSDEMENPETSRLKYPPWRKAWINRKADIVRILFRSPFIQVENPIVLREYYAVFLCILMGTFYILYNMWAIKSNAIFHFDTLHIVPAPSNGTCLDALEMGVKVLVGNRTHPMSTSDSFKDLLLSRSCVVLYCFSIGFVLLACFWQSRPTVIITLFFWMSLGVLARLFQAFHLDRKAVKELLCQFTRTEILLQQQQANEEPTLYASTASTNFKKSPMEKFQRDFKTSYCVSRKHYTQVALFLGIIIIFIHISGNLQRILADNFEEFYLNSTLFNSVCTLPYFSVLIDLFAHVVCLYVSITVYKIPMLGILITCSQSQAASFFTQHFPVMAPYTYPTRCPPMDPYEILHLWDAERSKFFQRMNRQINLVGGASDAFYTGFFLLLAIMLLFSSHTSFFLYNEYGLSITIATLATSLVLLVFVAEGEKAYKMIHYNQETVFWDWWSGAGLPSLERNVLTRPSPVHHRNYPALSCAGVPLKGNATIITVISLLWIWGKILCESYRYHTNSLSKQLAIIDLNPS